MSRRLSDPQRLVELVADQMFRESMRSRNGRGPAAGDGPAGDGESAPAEAASERPSPCDPPD
jgi:hypothetical protein